MNPDESGKNVCPVCLTKRPDPTNEDPGFVRYEFLPPANEVCEGYVFTGVCLSTGGACVVARRWGGVRGCSRGGRAWLLPGGHAWLLWGGMRGCLWWGGHAWLLWGGVHGCSWGACMVAPGGAGHAWLLWGGMRGFFDEIRSMSGRYASYWNAFLLCLILCLIANLVLRYQTKVNL